MSERRTGRAGLRATVLPLALALLAACGTTTPLESEQAISGGNGESQFTPGTAGAAGAASGGASGGSATFDDGAPTAVAAPTGSNAAQPGVPTASGAPGGAPGAPVDTGPKPPVEVGVMTLDLQEGLDLANSAGTCDSECSSALGYSQEAMVGAMADWINANGGLGGHPIEPVIYKMKFADAVARGLAAVIEEACQFWTKDHDVAALVLPNVVNEFLIACAASNDLPIMNGDYSQYVPDKEELQGDGRYDYASANFNLDDAATYYVNALVDQGFLKPGNNVGLIFKEGRIFERAIKNTLVPALQRRGFEIAAQAGWNDGTAGDDALWTQAVVKFRDKSVDRVLVFGGWNFGWGGFAKKADSQNYRPRYGVSSLVGPGDYKFQQIPVSQLEGAMGVGWWTFADIEFTGDAAEFNEAAAKCKELIVGAGQPWTTATYRNAMKFCDNFFLLKTLADRAGAVNQPAFYAAADQLGSSFVSPYTWATTFRPGDHHGATYLQNLVFNMDCECFQYVGEKYLPRW